MEAHACTNNEHNYHCSSMIKLKVIGLNVYGSAKKIYFGNFQDYIKDYDIVCLSETKIDSIHFDYFSGFHYFSGQKRNPSIPLFSGIHGLAMTISDRFKGCYEIINETKSDSVLWLKLDVPEASMLIGSVYIPHDCITLRSNYDLPFFIMVGDFNVRSGNIEDAIKKEIGLSYIYDALTDSKTELELLGFCVEQCNNDHHVNNNGHKLINLCKNIDTHIVNGRIGDDLGIGKLTCAGASTIDYALASPEIFAKIENFFVYEFDEFLSDKHCPIAIEIIIKRVQKIEMFRFNEL